MKILVSILLALSFSISIPSVVLADDGEVLTPGEVIEFDGDTLSFGDTERVTETLQCGEGEKPVVKCQKIKKPRKKRCPGQRTCNGHKGKFCWPKDRRCPLS